ncbi:MAG: AbrB/MazE/SpoVT family DNA-binding domain-containing protein [Gammaproteobacteria bacterium]|nr:AbrB/MazE/SpoVT family DNA-binding domain-containing protein [Gammaproteobacteria bacterium]
MAHLVKIGNSQGIRIPKLLIEQANLEGKELQLQVVEGGLLVSPVNGPREGWKESIEAMVAAQGAEKIDHEWLDAPLSNDDDLEW